MTSGYYRTPAVSGDQVVFVCEDDLWLVPLVGGIARRITSNLGAAAYPAFSPDGSMLAFTGTEEGEIEVYVMPSRGGAAKRVTYLGASHCRTTGWSKDNKVLFTSSYGQPFRGLSHLFEVKPDGTDLEELGFGPASNIAYSPDSGVVIGRNTDDPARWKRYRGGRAGQLWIDREGNGQFAQLIQLEGNLASPMWVGKRIYFLSDHEGIGNLYSCNPQGDDLQRHTDHNDYYARNASTDGKHIVYHAGGDLYAYDVEANQARGISVEFLSPQTQRNRKFVSPARYLESWNLHPQGEAVAITARGKLFSFFNWDGAVSTHGEQNGVRYRLPVWLKDGKQILVVTDSEGEERFVLFSTNDSEEAKLLPEMDAGRPMRMAANPRKDLVAFSNHRNELFCLDMETYDLQRIDQGTTAGVRGFAWSPDGEWLAYSLPVSHHVTLLKLWHRESGAIHPLTRPVLHDVAPAFDPEGKYLYFLSYRHFNPVYDNLHFDLSFPGGMKPYLITLQKDLPSPFRPVPQFVEEDEEQTEEKASDEPEETEEEIQEEGEQPSTQEEDESVEEGKGQEKDEEKTIQIDLDGIEDRVIAFPVADGKYGRVVGIEGGKVLYSRYPIEGELDKDLFDMDGPDNGTILTYSFESRKEETLIQGMTTFDLSLDLKKLIYLSGTRLRVLSAGSKPSREAKDKPGKESGWLDLWRVKVPVVPLSEWKQMFKEAWRLQRDHFWVEDMSKVNWLQIYERYLPLVERVSCRREFSDLMWEMQGELGTSHAYEFGGDYRPAPFYGLGLLGARFAYDEGHDGWRITHIANGDSWDERASSPLMSVGVNVKVGDVLLAVDGTRLGKEMPPGAALVNLARSEIFLTVLSKDEPAPDGEEKMRKSRKVTVRTISNEMPLYYREWVETNRAHVHKVTNGRVGYVHIPGMMAPGYAEFHRGFLAEVDREGLIVDVRFNDGGHVSALILEKLARRRIGYDSSRWSRIPEPYPPESILGPMVAITNEHAASDGDIFSHAFKLMNLGPLIGVRTWGGVIGISPKQILVDRTITTQPEYSFWFQDVGWGVENYGTDPDIVVQNLPQDYARGVDAQLERAIEEVLKIMEANPPSLPEFEEHPSRSLPRLPKR